MVAQRNAPAYTNVEMMSKARIGTSECVAVLNAKIPSVLVTQNLQSCPYRAKLLSRRNDHIQVDNRLSGQTEPPSCFPRVPWPERGPGHGAISGPAAPRTEWAIAGHSRPRLPVTPKALLVARRPTAERSCRKLRKITHEPAVCVSIHARAVTGTDAFSAAIRAR